MAEELHFLALDDEMCVYPVRRAADLLSDLMEEACARRAPARLEEGAVPSDDSWGCGAAALEAMAEPLQVEVAASGDQAAPQPPAPRGG